MKETACSVGPDAVKYIVSHAVVQVIFCVPETLNVVSICEIFHNIAYPFCSFVMNTVESRVPILVTWCNFPMQILCIGYTFHGFWKMCVIKLIQHTLG